MLIALTAKLEPSNKNFASYLYALLASICFTTTNFLVKALSGLSASEILFYRSIQLSAYTYFLMCSQNMQFNFKDPKIVSLLISRGFIGLFSMNMNYYGVKLIPLSEATVISQISPALVGVLAAVLLKEKYELSQFFGALFCVIGVVFIAQPEFLFHKGIDAQAHEQKLLGITVLFCATITISITQLLVKKIGGETNEGIVTLYFAAISTMFSPLISLYQGFSTPTLGDCGILALLGLFSFVGQMCRSKAYIIGKPGRVAIIGYFGIIYSIILDVGVLGNSLDMYSMIGAGFVFSTLFVFLYQLIQKERAGRGG